MEREPVSDTRSVLSNAGEPQHPHFVKLIMLKGVIQFYQCHMQESAFYGKTIEADGEIEYLIRYFAREPPVGTGARLMWCSSFSNRYFPNWTKKHAAHNPLDPLSQAMLGIVLGVEGDLEGADAAFDRAVALAPNHPDTLMVVAWSLPLIVGRAEEAVRHGRRAMALDPASPAVYAPALAVAQYAAGEYEEAVATLRLAPLEGVELMTYWAMAHAQLGHVEEAREAADRIRTECPSFTVEDYIRDFPIIAPAALAAIRTGAAKAGLLPAVAAETLPRASPLPLGVDRHRRPKQRC
jgi:tetratricopeptide (TPR) repeat protein